MFSIDPHEEPAWPLVRKDALSPKDVAHFRENGYIILRGAIAPEPIRDALRHINHQLGQPGTWVKEGPFAGQLGVNLPARRGEDEAEGIRLVRQSPTFWSAVNILLGEGNVAPLNGVQVALRFPGPPSLGHKVPDNKTGNMYHIDGMHHEHLSCFSLLCGVALSDQSRPNCGNLHVFPGSHVNKKMLGFFKRRVYEKTLPKDPNPGEPLPYIGESTQVLLKPGDVVLAHGLLAHAIGSNTCENIRYQLYYRFEHKDRPNLLPRIADDPWVEFAI
jgi:hypothetical protein